MSFVCICFTMNILVMVDDNEKNKPRDFGDMT